MEKKKGIIGSSDTPVITDKKVTTTPPTTSIGATAPSQSEEEYNENPQTPQTPPQTMPAQPQPTQVPPTAPSLAAQPQGEEYNETPQAPPTTPAPAVTTTAPQYNESDRRNQANLASQKGPEPPSANVVPTLQFDENNKPVLVDAVEVDKTPTPPTPTDTSTPPTPEGEEGEFRSYRDVLAKYAPLTSDEEKKKQMRREKRNAIIGALGDGLSALSNLYFTTKGAPDQGLKPGMTDAAKKRMDDLRAKWQAEKDKYQDLMLKGLEMDREQGNWLKSYKLQLNADKRADAEEERKAKTFEKELPLLEKKVQAAEEELKKLIRENNIGDATWQQSVEVAKEELTWKKYELEFMKSHKGYRPKEWEEHLATERYRSRTLSNNGGGGGGGKTYRIYNYNSTAYSDLTPNEVNRLYAALYSDGKVGKYSSLNDRVAAIQRYHSLNNDTYEVEVPVYYEDKDGKKKIRKYIKGTRRYKNRKDDAANGGRYDKMSTWTTVNGGNKSNGIIKINY